jgi:protein arginine kinase activator
MGETKRCDNCGKRDATIQLTQVENNEMKILQLCEKCAEERGVEVSAQKINAPLVDFLAQIGRGEAATGRCPSCGMTSGQLRQTGRLGCSTCYAHFDEHLRSLLRRLHGGAKHVGKTVLPADPGKDDLSAHLASLKRSLKKAVEAEDFEHAATLRDQLRRLDLDESTTPGGER